MAGTVMTNTVENFENMLLELCGLCSQNKQSLLGKIGMKQLRLVEMFKERENITLNQSSNGWISVDDELPVPEQEINFLDDRFEPSTFYLIQLKDGYVNTAYYATICDDCEYEDIFISCTVKAKDNRYYVQERGFDTYSINEVKFWQPLPQPPKE